MPKFSVDVKAFIKVEVEAPDADAARGIADDYVESITTRADGSTSAESGFSVDGTSDVEQLCRRCGNEVGDEPDGLCWSCQPEDQEPPEDTPSLDTSFHDHEMNV